MTLVKDAPPSGTRVLYHGTSTDRAAMIARVGFDISQTGANYGSSIAGQGVYTCLTHAEGEEWATQWQLPIWLPEWLTKFLDMGTVIEIYPPDDPHYNRETVPADVKTEDLPDYVAGLTDAHEIVLNEQCVLLTRRALEDPAVDIGYRVPR